MNVLRTLPLLVLATALTACAGKPARDSAPTSVPVTPTAADAALDAPADALPQSEVPAPVPADAVGDPAQSGADGTSPASAGGTAPTDAEDDFAALYGGPAPSADGTLAASAPYDPWEPFNRRVHSFNNVVDRAVARPLATAYTKVVPRFARTGVTNFFSNL
ncbi:MAG TPA: hypothetical protein DEB32_11970, partial [Stenotrophomonas sp.]|nr:hypothetical protein [Stenotrophomonas sp.]